MKFYTIIFSSLFLSIASFAQKTDNGIYLQLGGNGILGSINYERSILQKPLLKAFVGLGVYGINEKKLTIPVGINYLLPIYKNNVFLEAGVGATYTKAEMRMYIIVDRKTPYVNDKFINPVFNAGIRFQTKKSFLYKANITPVLSQYGIIPHIGFTFGKLF